MVTIVCLLLLLASAVWPLAGDLNGARYLPDTATVPRGSAAARPAFLARNETLWSKERRRED